jgi:diguanylate cyclase (GGDEF)-like protein
MDRRSVGIGHKARVAGVRRFRAQLILVAVAFSVLLYSGLYTQLQNDVARSLETEGASYINLLVNVGEWTAWHSSGELLSHRADDGTQVTFHLADLDPRNPVYEPDAWEQAALEAFYAGDASSEAMITKDQTGRVYRYIEPVRIREQCLECHAGYGINEPRGAISIEIPLGSADERLASGRLLYGSTSALALIGMIAMGSVFLGTFQRNIAAANGKLEEMAVTDELTGAPNRRAVLAHFEDEFERSRRTDEPLSVILIDIDHFKDVNDTLGHAAGDEVLIEVTDRAQASLRSYDTFGRMGGEEFLVVAPGTASQTAERLADRLLEALRTPAFQPTGSHSELFVTASAGVATLSDEDTGVDAMLARADEALYRAKSEGRDRHASAE